MPLIVRPIRTSGLFIEVRVGLSAPRRAQLWKRGLAIPPAVLATFIIDTGADRTMVDDQIMRTLGLTPTGQTRVFTSNSQGLPERCDVYDIELEIVNSSGQASWKIQPLAVLARPLINLSNNGMLGRDVLDMGLLTYDGPGRQFSLAY